jgi:hypothetical protein
LFEKNLEIFFFHNKKIPYCKIKILNKSGWGSNDFFWVKGHCFSKEIENVFLNVKCIYLVKTNGFANLGISRFARRMSLSPPQAPMCIKTIVHMCALVFSTHLVSLKNFLKMKKVEKDRRGKLDGKNLS